MIISYRIRGELEITCLTNEGKIKMACLVGETFLQLPEGENIFEIRKRSSIGKGF